MYRSLKRGPDRSFGDSWDNKFLHLQHFQKGWCKLKSMIRSYHINQTAYRKMYSLQICLEFSPTILIKLCRGHLLVPCLFIGFNLNTDCEKELSSLSVRSLMVGLKTKQLQPRTKQVYRTIPKSISRMSLLCSTYSIAKERHWRNTCTAGLYRTVRR